MPSVLSPSAHLKTNGDMTNVLSAFCLLQSTTPIVSDVWHPAVKHYE
jgi:hypothetical protein